MWYDKKNFIWVKQFLFVVDNINSRLWDVWNQLLIKYEGIYVEVFDNYAEKCAKIICMSVD